MLLIILLAGAAALAVVSYTRLRTRSPEAATALVRGVRELAAVVLVCSKAAEGIVDALQAPSRARYAPAGDTWGGYARPLVDTWEEE